MVAWHHVQKQVRYSDANVDDPDGVELDIAATSIQPSSKKSLLLQRLLFPMTSLHFAQLH